MPQLPACFPPLPPSSLQLRSFELYRSSVFIVLVKTDKFSNITFEYFDIREKECVGVAVQSSSQETTADEPHADEKSHNSKNSNNNNNSISNSNSNYANPIHTKKRSRLGVRKKMGYIITTMTPPSPPLTYTPPQLPWVSSHVETCCIPTLLLRASFWLKNIATRRFRCKIRMRGRFGQ